MVRNSKAFETLSVRLLAVCGIGTLSAMGILLHAKSTGNFGLRTVLGLTTFYLTSCVLLLSPLGAGAARVQS